MSDITLDTAVAKAPEAAPRTAPMSQIGLVGWLRANLFSSWINTAVTLVRETLPRSLPKIELSMFVKPRTKPVAKPAAAKRPARARPA